MSNTFQNLKLMLLLLSLCTPTVAATVSMVDNADGTLTVTISTEAGEANIVGLALDIDVDSGAAVMGVSIDTPCFNIFPDAAFDLGGSYSYGEGIPVCFPNVPGQAILPAANFTLCAGCLNGAATPGADGAAAVQFTLTLDTPATVCVSENAIRGGIVLTDGTGEDITNGTEGVVCNIGGPGECIDSGAASYADWISLGSPDCWCYERQCNGDVDGLSVGSKLKGFAHVETNDLNVLLASWNVKEPTKGPGILSIPQGECADFDHTAVGSKLKGFARVETNDLNLLLANWQVKEPTKGPGVPSCPLAGAGGDIVYYMYP
jgi:hypothetical protein